METNIVKTRSRCVIAQQFRRIAVGQAPQLQRFGRPQLLANARQQIAIPARAFADDGFTQGGIGRNSYCYIAARVD
jgi:hypothetical protein